MTFELIPFLKDMLSAPGLSGYERPIRDIISRAWEPLSDELSLSNLGSLLALKRGEGPEPRPTVMIAVHMDAIGLMVTAIEDGFLRFTQVGGVDPRILPGQPVIVHASNSEPKDLPALVVMPPAQLLPKEAGTGPLAQAFLLVDTGLRARDVEKLVRVGDIISFASKPEELAGDTIAGHTLDNRASVAAATVALEMLQKRRHQWDVVADATVQEEVGVIGGLLDPIKIKPDLAIVVDVTFATGPGGSGSTNFELGGGISMNWGANVHPALYKALEETAKDCEIPIYKEFSPSMSGTDAYGIQVAEEGIPVVEIGIPLRYMHTPVEQVAIKDIQRAGRLMAEFITNLPLDFMNTVKWE
jgi:endoglucanase